MYRHLGGGDREEANLALRLLTTAAARGPEHAHALLRGFDWDHKALAKLAKPARCGAPAASPPPTTSPLDCVAALRCSAWRLHVRSVLRNFVELHTTCTYAGLRKGTS